MSSFASHIAPFFAAPQPSAAVIPRVGDAAALESAAFTHALVALAAKLAVVDGAPNTAEYAAFQALFVDAQGVDGVHLRSLFVKRVMDHSSALQYARQIAEMTVGQADLHRDLLGRLLRIATADAALNAAEIELLRAVADVLGIAREEFRALIGRSMSVIVSPYVVLGVSPQASDTQLRDAYMARVRTLHPDRYHAAGASAETMAMLSDQLASVNAAYRSVQELRAKKSTRSTTSSAKKAPWWSLRNTKGAKAD